MKVYLNIVRLTLFLFFIGCNSNKEDLSVNTPSIQCGMCQKTIEMGLSKLAGVTNPKVDLKTKTTSMSYNPDKININSIEQKISDLGYQANQVKANEAAYADLPACCKIGGMDKM